MSQAKNLKRFQPHFAGIQHKGGIPLPPEQTCSLAQAGIYGEAMARFFKITGYSPGFVDKIRSSRPKVVHAHFEESGLAAVPVAHQLGVPLITTFHGYDVTARPLNTGVHAILQHVYAHQRRRLQKEGTVFVAVSNFIRQKLIERGYPDSRIAVVPIGVDTEYFSPSSQTEIKRSDSKKESHNILFVGRLVEKKGLTYLIQAMVEVNKRFPKARLVVIGDGPLLEDICNQIVKLGLRNVKIRGSCPPAVIRAEMAKAAMLVAPSVTAASGDSDGLPIVICEAQAMGLPVIGTRHAGIPEVIHDGIDGFIIPEKDVNRMAKAICFLLDNPNFRRLMGQGARKNACLSFNLKRQTDQLETIYSDAVSEFKKFGQKKS
jgi:colanic acid/amylovoran biosynthesis glycosyltransferase